MASSLTQLSACVTRILSLTGFPKELKTRDIQTAFSEWENVGGGFKIKWIDDTSLLIVFQDATVGELSAFYNQPSADTVVVAAKRAYLHALAFPPAILSKQAPEAPTVIRPYDGPDAQNVIQTVNSRHMSSASRAHNSRASMSHGRSASAMSSSNSFRNGVLPGLNGTAPIPEHPIHSLPSISPRDREPSPTLPNLPAHPTLNALISSTLASPNIDDAPPSDPAILAIGGPAIGLHENVSSPPRIGDPGKRMLGAALGVRHPGLGPRVIGQRSASSNEHSPVAVTAE